MFNSIQTFIFFNIMHLEKRKQDKAWKNIFKLFDALIKKWIFLFDQLFYLRILSLVLIESRYWSGLSERWRIM
jgi:hypothetical protein